MADVVGKAKIVAEFDNKEALSNLERYRRRLMETGRSYDKLFKEDFTRKFSENFRKGFEQGVLRGVERGENKFYQLERAIGIAATSLDKIKAPAQMAADSFFKLQRAGIKFQAAAGTITGAVGDLVGGFYSLVGIVGAAAPALVTLGSTMIGVGIGFVGVKVAMSGVANAISTVWKSQTALNDTFRAATQEYIGLKFAAEAAALSQEDAALKLESAREALARVQDLPPDNRLRRQTELAFKQADLQLRQAKHKSEESFRAVKKGIEATSAYQPLASLSAVQLEFVKFVVTLRPLMQQMKKEVAAGFIPKLTEAIQTLMKYGFPEFKEGLKQVASAMGTATKVFANAFKDDRNILNLRSLFDSSTKTIGHFGKAVASTFGAFLTILNAAVPLTERFAKFISDSLGNLDRDLKFKDFNGDLDRTFQLAGDVAARIGSVFKGVYDGVKNIVKAAFPSGARSGAGGVMLDFLDDMVDTFKKFTSDKGFSEWLRNATTGAVEVLRTVGQFLAIFTDLAGNKNTADFFIILRDAIPYVKTILENGQKAGTELANVLVNFTRIIAAVADAGVVVTFFGTLNTVLKILADVLLSPAFQAFLNFIGHIHGPILALGAVVIIAMKAFKIFFGYMMNGLNALAKFSSSMKAADRSFETFRKETKMARLEGDSFFKTLAQVSRAARDSRLLQLSRDAGVAKDRLAQLELQMLSNSRSATLYNEKTKQTIQYQDMNQAEALQMAVRYEKLALEAGMAAREVQVLNAQLLNNIQAANGAQMTNQSLLAGTTFAGGNYRAPYMAGAPGGAGGGGGGVAGPGGKSGFMRTLGGIAGGRGFGGGVGRGGIMGGIGMAATVGSSLAGLGTGVTSETGMAVQALAGVASMFGPAGMVVGGLMSIGSVIADSINAAAAAELFKIRQINIDSATISANNLNQDQEFGSEAVRLGFTNDLQAMRELSSDLQLAATTFLTEAEKKNLTSIATIKDSDQLKEASLAVGLGSKRGLEFLGKSSLQPKIQQAALSIGNTGLFDPKQTGTIIGQLAGITEKNKKDTLDSLRQQSPAFANALKGFKFDFNDKGQLTTASFEAVLKKVSMAGRTPFIPTNAKNNVLGLTAPGGSRSRLPGAGALEFKPVLPTDPTISKGLNVSGLNVDAFKGYFSGGGAAGGKLITANNQGQFTGLVPGQERAAGNAIQGVTQALTGVKGGISDFAGIITNVYDSSRPGGTRGILKEGTYTQAQIEQVSADYDLWYNSLTALNRKGKAKKFKDMFGKDQLVQNPDGSYKLQNTGAEGYNTGNFKKAYNVAGTVLTESQIRAALKNKTYDSTDKDGNPIKISLDTLVTQGKLDNLVRTSIATGLTNPILEAATDSANVQSAALKTASTEQKNAAAAMGIASAKIEGFGKIVADNANRAIAFAMIQATAEGKAAINSGDVNRVSSLLNAQLTKLGLSTKP
jgi:hypothetical protein